MRGALVGVIATLAIAASTGAAVVALGLASVAADQAPSSVEARLFGAALRSAVARQARTEPEPPRATAADLASGREIYDEMCARCHGRPGAAASALGSSFYPPAPLLAAHATEWSERELSWIIKHGIRNTGMPAWAALLSDDDIHRVAAVVKRFDERPSPG